MTTHPEEKHLSLLSAFTCCYLCLHFNLLLSFSCCKIRREILYVFTALRFNSHLGDISLISSNRPFLPPQCSEVDLVLHPPFVFLLKSYLAGCFGGFFIVFPYLLLELHYKLVIENRNLWSVKIVLSSCIKFTIYVS